MFDNFKKNSFLFFVKALIALIMYFLVFNTFYNKSKTITSGYHLQNDHEFLRMGKDLKTIGFYNSVLKWHDWDMYNNFRFRPSFYGLELISVQLFGDSIKTQSIISFIAVISTCFFFYLFLTVIEFNFFIAIVFPLLTIVGTQMIVFWKLGQQENIGILCLSIFLFLFVLFEKYEINKYLKNIFYVVILFMCVNVKESFLLITPFLIIFMFFIKNNYLNINIKNALLDILPISILLILNFIVCLYYILIVVGTDGANGGGAGVDSSISLMNVVVVYLKSIQKNDLFYLFIFGLLNLFVLVVINYQKSKENAIAHNLVFYSISIFLLYFSIVIPQHFIYLKSGMSERYFLPHQLGYVIFICFNVNYLFINLKNLNLKYLLIVIFLVCLQFKYILNLKKFYLTQRTLPFGEKKLIHSYDLQLKI